MNESQFYEIRIKGLLSEGWSDWLDGLAIDSRSGEETTLHGRLADQAALLGVLSRIHALNLKLISVNKLPSSGSLEVKGDRRDQRR